MAKPDDRRQVVAYVRGRYAVSERQACRVFQLNRRTCRNRCLRGAQDEPLRQQLRQCAEEKQRWGSRSLRWLVNQRGLQVGKTRFLRVYREEGLQIHRRKRRRKGPVRRSPMPPPDGPNQQWAMDFMSDRIGTQKTFRMLNVIDVFTRECLASEVDTSLTGHRVVRVLKRLKQQRGKPVSLTMDSGPEFAGRTLAEWAYSEKIDLRFIQPAKPQQNAFCESFNGIMREQCLNQHYFTCLEDAYVKIQQWRNEYNHHRPHGSLNYQPPAQFARNWAQQHDECVPL